MTRIYDLALRPRRSSLLVPLIFVVVVILIFLSNSLRRPISITVLEDPLKVPAVETFYNALNSSACERISSASRTKFQTASEPEAYVLIEGEISEAGGQISAPQEVCIIVAVPQHHLPYEIYPDAPVHNAGPDIIHLYVNSSDVRMTFPPLRPLPNQRDLQMQVADAVILYYAETVFLNAGEYEISVEQEWSNWRWAQQWFWNPQTQLFNYLTDVQPFNLGEEHLWQPWTIPDSRKHPPMVKVTGGMKMPSRPKCSDSVIPAKGRWYRQETFRSLFPELADEWGFTWQGDQCHLDYYNPVHMFDCLANKTIHVYGDSMIRRVMKHVLSGGQWCHDPEAICQDGDDALNDKQFVQILQLDENGQLHTDDIAKDDHFKNGDHSEINFGKNSTVFFTFLTALTNQSSAWMDALYDEESLVTVESRVPSDRMLKPGAVPRAPPSIKAADLVVLGFGAWDQAYTDNFEQYRFMLTKFKNSILKAYEGIPIIMRLANSWCCRDTDIVYRRFTGGRVQKFDDVLREVFEVEGGKGMGGRMSVFDPSYMNGRPEVLIDYGYSTANHPRAAHGRIEMQMMMNSLCVKDKAGHASFRMDQNSLDIISASNMAHESGDFEGSAPMEIPVWVDADESAVDQPVYDAANGQQWTDSSISQLVSSDPDDVSGRPSGEHGNLNKAALLKLSEGMEQPDAPPPQGGLRSPPSTGG